MINNPVNRFTYEQYKPITDVAEFKRIFAEELETRDLSKLVRIKYVDPVTLTKIMCVEKNGEKYRYAVEFGRQFG